MSAIRILVRQSPDWRGTPFDELIEGSRAFCRLVGAAAGIDENFIRDVVAVWDRAFALPFFEVRAAMKEIAARNLAAVAEASIEPLAAADPRAGADLPCLFIDDDDWLHPQVAALLAPHLRDGSDGWIFGNILCIDRVELRGIRDGCYTNNYAVSAAFLAQQSGFAALAQHWDAHRTFHTPGFGRAYVPLYLSATNKHPASTMKLKDGLQEQPLCAATLRALVGKFLDGDASAPPEAQWVQPYRAAVRDVFARL